MEGEDIRIPIQDTLEKEREREGERGIERESKD
jgi:hypothetical protein